MSQCSFPLSRGIRADTRNRTGVSTVPRWCNYRLYDNCLFVPLTGFEPAHSDFKPDTTANYVTRAFVPLPRFELGHYASKAHTTANYVIEANKITEESLEE